MSDLFGTVLFFAFAYLYFLMGVEYVRLQRLRNGPLGKWYLVTAWFPIQLYDDRSAKERWVFLSHFEISQVRNVMGLVILERYHHPVLDIVLD